VMNAIERRQGLLDFLTGKQQKELGELTPANATDLKVGKYTLVRTITDNNQRKVCQERAEDILLQETDLACLIGLWEYNPPAILAAVRGSKNPTKPAIVGFDENYETLDGVKSGEILAAMVRDGNDSILKSYKDMDNLNRIVIPHRVITREAGPLPETTATLPVDPFYAELKKLKGDTN
jgi:ABC-type sugar transport system substrate-binding protein